ncbi:MAG: flagellin [Gemmatimonadetes bacterium]|nr:flagellin [Gemmatimonadota bacterium]
MRINTNVSALNTLRTLSGTGKEFAKSVGRLSSGFRINRAADDAAGLGIANKMRADLRSMRQASRNAEQAGSLLQVAEGGAQTISQIVDRMKELATQAASDNVDSAGRTRINSEFAALRSEITRVVGTTKFQGSTLLNGTLGNAVDLAAAGTTLDAATGFGSAVATGAVSDTYTFTQTAGAVTLTNSTGSLTQVVTAVAGGAQDIVFDKFGITVSTHANFAIDAGDENLEGDLVVAGSGTSFLVSSSAQYAAGAADNVSLSSMDLTIATLGIAADSLATKAGAQTALASLDTAVGRISDVFANIGAAQNRIEYAQQATDAAVENISAAESVIRDVDMADEVTRMTKYQILQQAGTAMLAQANQAPQSVLSLLR